MNFIFVCVHTHRHILSYIYIYEDGTYSVCINVYLYIPPSVYLTGMYMSKAVCVYHIHINKINTGTHVVPHSVCAEGKSMYGDFFGCFS